ncbi:MAG: von Willebrand factor, type [Candidatus Solibacter sp.]|nr:von Willebrand factor, type [Candidatus Solibacter sp.]
MRTCLLAMLLSAQIELNPPKGAGVITVDVELVNVLCSVRDPHGAYVKDLNREDFEIREDGTRQEITHFAREVDTPMTVALLLDVSGSVSNIIGTEKTAGQRFFDEVLRPADRALLVGFADRIAVWQDLTGSKPLLQDALERAGPYALPTVNREVRSRGGTLLYDAVKLVADQKLKRLPGRKAMILITDGEDNGSIATPGNAMKAAQEADTVVYGIHYVDDNRFSSQRDGRGALEKLSGPTGGRTFHVTDKLPLAGVFAAIVEEMRNQYGLGYRPPAAKTGVSHRLEVKSTKSALKVQARTEYYR